MIRYNIRGQHNEELYEGTKTNYYGNYISKSELAKYLEDAGFERVKDGNEEGDDMTIYYALYVKK